MSIRKMAQVWEKSQHKGTALLLLLAIADNANDEQIAWPSIITLSKKIRMSHRFTRLMVRKLAQSGELEILEEGGGHRSTRYKITLQEETSPGRWASPGRPTSSPGGGRPPRREEAGLPAERRQASPEPSVNHQETINTTATAVEPAAAAADEWNMSLLFSLNGIRTKNPSGSPEKFIGLYLYAMTQAKLTSPARYANSRMEDGNVTGLFRQLSEIKPSELAAVLDYVSGRDDLFGVLGGSSSMALALRDMVPTKDRAARIERAFAELGLEHLPEPKAIHQERIKSPELLWSEAIRSSSVAQPIRERLSGRTVRMDGDVFVVTVAEHDLKFFEGHGKSQIDTLLTFVDFRLEAA
jgi:hypothetical protein